MGALIGIGCLVIKTCLKGGGGAYLKGGGYWKQGAKLSQYGMCCCAMMDDSLHQGRSFC